MRAFPAVVLLALPVAALGDTVRLRSGDVIEGEARDLGDRVEVVGKDGKVSVRWRDVDVVLRDKTALDLFRERRAALDKRDAKGLYALALWAERAGLEAERRECLEAAAAADPENAAVRSALAQQKADGRWLEGAALLSAKGFVGRDGAWVLKEEAESLERRAEAAKGFLPAEKRAEEILSKSSLVSETARKFAVESLAGLDQEAVRRPALRTLRRGEPAAREVAARALGKSRDRDVLRPLISSAVLDREPLVREAAALALKEFGDVDAVKALARGMWSSLAEVRMNSAEALGAYGGGWSVEWLIRRVSSSGGPGGRNHLSVMNQQSYISDFDVEVAQAAQVGDPIVGVLRDGVMLDCRVLNAREEWTQIERRVFYRALKRATGKDLGEDAAAWAKWYESEGRTALATAR